jgi:hypothetical protein
VCEGSVDAAGDELELAIEGWPRSPLGDPSPLPATEGALTAVVEDGTAGRVPALGPDGDAAAGSGARDCTGGDDCEAGSSANAGRRQAARHINNSPVVARMAFPLGHDWRGVGNSAQQTTASIMRSRRVRKSIRRPHCPLLPFPNGNVPLEQAMCAVTILAAYRAS